MENNQSNLDVINCSTFNESDLGRILGLKFELESDFQLCLSQKKLENLSPSLILFLIQPMGSAALFHSADSIPSR